MAGFLTISIIALPCSEFISCCCVSRERRVAACRSISYASSLQRWARVMSVLARSPERALILSDGMLITAEHLGTGGRREARRVESLPGLKKCAIANALAGANGNQSRAAAALGLTRFQLYAHLKRFGLPK